MAPAMAMHRAVQVRDAKKGEYSSLGDRLQMAMVPTPRAQRGEVVVHMLCRPVHPADLLSLAGTYPPWQPPQLPATFRLEGMGVVHELGEGVMDENGLREGQRVFPYISRPDLEGHGSWQEFLVAPVQDVFPDSVSDYTGAAQFYVNPWSSNRIKLEFSNRSSCYPSAHELNFSCHASLAMLRELTPQKGDHVIQSAAASTLGRMIVQGFKTINLVRHNTQKAELKALGADDVIHYVEENVEVLQRVKKLTKDKMAHDGLNCMHRRQLHQGWLWLKENLCI